MSNYPNFEILESSFEPEKDEYIIKLPEEAKQHLEDLERYVMHCVYSDYEDWQGIELIGGGNGRQKIVPITELYDRVKLTEESQLSFDCQHPTFLYSAETNSLEFQDYIWMFSNNSLATKYDFIEQSEDEWEYDSETGEYILDLGI